MNKIIGIIRWTIDCVVIYLSNLKEVCKSSDVYWDCRQTFFTNEKDRKIYQQKENELIDELKIERSKKTRNY